MSAEDGVSGQQWSVDADYVKTMGLKVVKGRDFSPVALDSQSVIINEALEIARRYSAPESVSFLNGVLDAMAKELVKKI